MITNTYLIEYAKAQVGKAYWNGTFGQGASKSLYASNKKRLPGEYKWSYNGEYDGQKVHDCHGLIKGAFWCKDKNSTAYVYQKDMPDCDIPTAYNRCTEKGSIASIPSIPGLYVFTSNFGHIGIYDGNGYVYEAKGHAWGVVKSKLTERPCFTKWGKDTKMIKFESAPVKLDYVAKVRSFQTWLNSMYSAGLVVDGHAGKKTMSAAVKALQTELNKKYNCGLVVDGRYGILTKKALTSHMIVKKEQGNLAYLIQGLLYSHECDCKGFDGSIGDGCVNAIKAFQKGKGIEVDGKVGSETFLKLIQ